MMLVPALLLALIPQSVGGHTEWSTSADEIVAKTPAYTLHMDAATGAPRSLQLAGGSAITFGPDGWWRLELADGSVVKAADNRSKLLRNGDDLSITGSSPQAHVELTVHCGAAGIELRTRVRSLQQPITAVSTPAQISFRTDSSLRSLSFPFELGRELLPDFFRQVASNDPAQHNWSLKSFGTRGAVEAGIRPARDRDYNEPPVAATVTEAGKQWLAGYAAQLNGWTVRCPRAPEGVQETTLLDTPSGPLLSLQSVDGGWGRMVRWGGVFTPEDMHRVIAASVQTVQHLWNSPVTPGDKVQTPAGSAGKLRSEVLPKQIGFIDPGSAPYAAAWRAALERLKLPITTISTTGQLRDHLKAGDCWLIVNPFGEALPAVEADAVDTAHAIRDFIVNGGVWLHTGGYPFFAVIDPLRYLQISSTYPPAFSDFVHLSMMSAEVSLYGVQAATATFVPVNLSTGGGPGGGTLTRAWMTWIAPQTSLDLPLTRFAFGEAAEVAIRRYGTENGFTRPLSEKISAQNLATLKRSLLVRYAGVPCNAMREGLPLLPVPSLVHIAEYLHGGFDKEYPDHLPPNSWFGTVADFSSLVQEIHRSGRLFMPYTNPTWWCDGPPGPTLQRAGDAPLSKDRNGKPVRESYGKNYGWSLCTFHPEALKAEQIVLNQFSAEYPSDVLFQDQIGARGPLMDFNPSSPTPYAYTQGMIDIAKRDSRKLPLSTEIGFDAVLNYETQLCGLTWGLVPTQDGPDWRELWRDRFPSGTWRFQPLALWLAHDRVVFDHHDLGQFVTNRETLSWSLALGYQLSVVTDPAGLKDLVRSEWIKWLAAIQNTFGPELIGAPLTAWSEPTAGIYRARFGKVSIVANTTMRPYSIDPQNVLSPFGFWLQQEGSDIEAGWFDRYHGQNYPGDGYAFVQTADQKRTIDTTRYPTNPPAAK